MHHRRRILVALEPVVLEGALAVLLGASPVNEVVQYHQAGADLSGGYDAAVVTGPLGDDVWADVVITLPEAGGDAVGHVRRRGVDVTVDLRSPEQVRDLLEEQFAAR